MWLLLAQSIDLKIGAYDAKADVAARKVIDRQPTFII